MCNFGFVFLRFSRLNEPPCRVGQGGNDRKGRAIGSHLLYREVVVTPFGRATWLGPEALTVAGQHRTCTGFAFEPSHPGERHPAGYLIDLIVKVQPSEVK